MTHNNSEAILTIRAWWDLYQAFANFNADLHRHFNITGSQLALLRIIAERQPVTIRTLRRELHWHPASLGQAVQRLVARGMVTRTPSEVDGRVRVLDLTQAGQALIDQAPLVGPVRLRQCDVPHNDLLAMRQGFKTAMDAFALTPWSHGD